MYISLIEMYQVKPRSSPWFSAACATAVVHRNLFFFFCTNRINLLSIKQSSDRLVIVPKRVLEAAKLAHANKTKESIISQKLGSQDFWRIASSILNKGKSAIPPLFNGPEVLTCASDKAKLCADFFSKISHLDDRYFFYLFSLLELI